MVVAEIATNSILRNSRTKCPLRDGDFQRAYQDIDLKQNECHLTITRCSTKSGAKYKSVQIRHYNFSVEIRLVLELAFGRHVILSAKYFEIFWKVKNSAAWNRRLIEIIVTNQTLPHVGILGFVSPTTNKMCCEQFYSIC